MCIQENLRSHQTSPVILPSNDRDNLWQALWYFRNSFNYRPNSSGYMQNTSKGEY